MNIDSPRVPGPIVDHGMKIKLYAAVAALVFVPAPAAAALVPALAADLPAAERHGPPRITDAGTDGSRLRWALATQTA
jgi:hypothetical protein